MTIAMEQKAGFNIKTLHVKLDDPIDKSMKGTDFTIYDLSDTDITNAKSMFLVFNKPSNILLLWIYYWLQIFVTPFSRDKSVLYTLLFFIDMYYI